METMSRLREVFTKSWSPALPADAVSDSVGELFDSGLIPAGVSIRLPLGLSDYTVPKIVCDIRGEEKRMKREGLLLKHSDLDSFGGCGRNSEPQGEHAHSFGVCTS
jgi:hypothetical protein